MMKYFFAMIFLIIMSFIEIKYFWLIVGILVMFSLFFMFNTLSFSPDLYLGYGLYVDLLSFSLIFLSFWITFLMLMSSYGVYKNNYGATYFLQCVVGLFLILLITFSSMNLLTFYFYFEASLIPTLLLITGWGYQPERLQAGVYFLFYTLTASLPLLMVFFYLFNKCKTLDFGILTMHNFDNFGSFYLFMGFTMAFLVKMPMFFTHLWLPKAHVEAPVSGSMILAGVLLKLGGYGFYRVLFFCSKSLKIFGSYFFGVSVLGMLYVGFICCRLNDMKALVAYSSVAHMGLVICGVYSGYMFGYEGSLMMMLSHGLASSGLFCLVNMYYERSSSRSIFFNKGMILLAPLFTLFMFFLAAANMAAPPTLNLMSEIFLMISIIKFDYIMMLIFPLSSYMGAVFTLFLFSFSQHGFNYSKIYSYSNSNFREYQILFLHVVPVNFLILKPDYFVYLS